VCERRGPPRLQQAACVAVGVRLLLSHREHRCCQLVELHADASTPARQAACGKAFPRMMYLHAAMRSQGTQVKRLQSPPQALGCVDASSSEVLLGSTDWREGLLWMEGHGLNTSWSGSSEAGVTGSAKLKPPNPAAAASLQDGMLERSG
jgi:hypothetical protein